MTASSDAIDDCAPHEHEAPVRQTPVPSEVTLERAAALFGAAGDVARLRLLDALRDGEQCVTELAAAMDAKMSTISQQLRLLREANLVTSRRAGKHIWYALADTHVALLLQNVLEHADPDFQPTRTHTHKEHPMTTITHEVHENHVHTHSEHCGHTRIAHEGHVDFLHDGHLHSPHEGHYDEHVIAVSDANPAQHSPIACLCGHDDCGHEQVRHGDHMDFLVDGRLHHKHDDHCDDHGPVAVIG